ncbi:hypothetical protein [Pseudorhodoferax sp. Leaf267]|uniref:hypothetical protein n=1 Tax=Pseudorhodoferax sp. Leaf267 TaxID=1736316 RepID=UPI0012E20C72|nr:hypothetical protein [Pseudorhodoferax sp. Leaf267]
MKQIRIAATADGLINTSRYASEWMAGSTMNVWMLRARLAEALLICGADSYRVETRDQRTAPSDSNKASSHPDAVEPVAVDRARVRCLSSELRRVRAGTQMPAL